jgi:hypothetical protein
LISPGALVVCKQTGRQLFVVKEAADNGLRWKIVGKLTDDKGRALFTARVAGRGDLTLIREAETYEPGELLEYGGLELEVARDLGSGGRISQASSQSSSCRWVGARTRGADHTVQS